MPSAATARWVSNSPSSSPISISSVRSSTYFPAYGFSMTATDAARRVGGWTIRPISLQISSTKVASLRIFAFIFGLSSQAVLSLDIRRFQSPNSSVNARAGGHDERQHYFIGARSISQAYLHSVKMAAHVRGIDMGNGNVQSRS